jgi:hypothetical protein
VTGTPERQSHEDERAPIHEQRLDLGKIKFPVHQAQCSRHEHHYPRAGRQDIGGHIPFEPPPIPDDEVEHAADEEKHLE